MNNDNQEAPSLGAVISTGRQYREIVIRKVNNGFIINVGCQTFVEKDWEQVNIKLMEYFTDPIAAEKKYVEK
jgi:hypothetical protein